MMDFILARKKRQKLLSLLRQQQKADSDCVRQMKCLAIEGKRTILTALARWIVKLDGGANITNELRMTLGKATNRIAMDDWLGLRRESARLESALKTAKNSEQDAEHKYKGLAPLGFMSIMFMDQPKKSLANAAKALHDDLRRLREDTEQRLTNNRGAIGVACDYFLHDAMRPDALRLLCDDAILSPLILPTLTETTDRAASIWKAHSTEQAKCVAAMTEAVAALRTMYSTDDGDTTRLLAVKE
jgi:hypothetical protein